MHVDVAQDFAAAFVFQTDVLQFDHEFMPEFQMLEARPRD